MAASTVERILAEVRTWPRQEQEQLQRALDALLCPVTEDEFEQRLVGMGLLSSPVVTGADPAEWRPVEVRGRPVSETLIEERR